MNTETKVEIKLFDWLIKNGVEVYFNRTIKELNNKNIFTTTQKEKPDLILYSHKLKKYIAVEVKVAKKNNIRDSRKIIYYQQEYQKKNTQIHLAFSNDLNKYFIEGKEVNISFFIVATENSINGSLMYEDAIESPHNEEWHKILQQTRNEPIKEHPYTKEFTRSLWNSWKTKPNIKKPYDSGIGVLLSSLLDADIKRKPMIFVQEYNVNKKRWCVRWLEI